MADGSVRKDQEEPLYDERQGAIPTKHGASSSNDANGVICVVNASPTVVNIVVDTVAAVLVEDSGIGDGKRVVLFAVSTVMALVDTSPEDFLTDSKEAYIFVKEFRTYWQFVS